MLCIMSDYRITLVILIPKAIALKVSLWNECFPFTCVVHTKPQSQHCNFTRLSLIWKLECAFFHDIYEIERNSRKSFVVQFIVFYQLHLKAIFAISL